ncbi:siroheme synthase-like protein [Catenibacillus scindens]|uniref:precorrin-2 dehydrogenase n=1 Tax=Catenibacillus scindens TaxID=673271 RepID=A0A7W8HDF4_9FIRM|nr:bifunctional precorrin-2 dehydrogenase/sirohydrochlorin ferrochelatase [Catenibacillus scindens]MBB5265938.1 siroheme synthase-like protein [Catenibacillus scindens]
MALFPMFVNIRGRYCLVLGGGCVALRKIRTLLLAGGEVHVCSREYAPPLTEMAAEGKVFFEGADALEECLSKAFLVVCAASDQNFNERIARLCQSRRIPVNCATSEKLSTFIFPSVVMSGPVAVGICVDPPAPSLSAHIRREIESFLPEWYGPLGEELGKLRVLLRPMVASGECRRRIMERLTDYGLEHQGHIPMTVFYNFIEEEEQNEDH